MAWPTTTWATSSGASSPRRSMRHPPSATTWPWPVRWRCWRQVSSDSPTTSCRRRWAARVIPNIQPDGITEFPWFSLILGDLHPHFVALPFDLLAIGLAMAVLANLLARRDHQWLDVGAAAVGLGVLIPLNTWDVGTFWIVYAAAVVAALLATVGAFAAGPGAPR